MLSQRDAAAIFLSGEGLIGIQRVQGISAGSSRNSGGLDDIYCESGGHRRMGSSGELHLTDHALCICHLSTPVFSELALRTLNL